MLINAERITEGLQSFKLTRKNISLVSDIIGKQLLLYKKLNLVPSNVDLVIISKKIEGVNVLRVFEKNNILIDVLDYSYTSFKTLSIADNKDINFILRVSFLDGGKYIDVVKCKLIDVLSLGLTKVKNVTYVATDYEDVVKLDISLQDVKGAEYEVLKNAVIYAFNKKTKKKLVDLDCIAVAYS